MDQFHEPLVESMETNRHATIGDGKLGPDGLLSSSIFMSYRVGDTVKISAYYLRGETLGIVYFEPER